jgi:hypothetical protein
MLLTFCYGDRQGLLLWRPTGSFVMETDRGNPLILKRIIAGQGLGGKIIQKISHFLVDFPIECFILGLVREIDSEVKTMRVNTNQFQFAHGKQPRGVGFWAFEFVLPRRVVKQVRASQFEQGATFETETVVPERTLTLWHNGPFGEASKLARLAATQLKATSVSVGS